MPRVPRRAALLACLVLAGCGKPRLVLQDDGMTPPNSCVVTACLETLKHPHSCVVLVRYLNSEQGHAYCLWLENGEFFASDRRGTVALHLTKRQVAGVTDALPVPIDGLIPASAELMKPSKLK